MPNLFVNAVSTWNGNALKKASKQISGFDKTVKNLGKTFAGVFAAQKLLNYGKASVKAFVADDKAARVLGKSLDNLGLSYANPAVKDFISSLETQFGVLDDQLRPAYQKLITTTGDWRRSQDLMKTALDLSAMSGTDVVSVAGDLSKAYAGNTRGLMKYGLGLSKTQLAAMSFDEILTQITKISGGQATLAANTYSGALDKLQVAAANAQETIGKGLVQALTEVSGANGFDGALKGISDFSSGVSDAIIGVERLAKIFGFFIYNTKGTNPITQMNEFNAANAKSDMLSRQKYGGAYADKYIAEADKASAAKLAKAKKDELAILTAKNKLAAAEAQAKLDQAKLDELKKKFDLERIGIAAGIAKTEEELSKTKDSVGRASLLVELDRLKLQQALLDENAKAATAANDALKKAEDAKLAAETLAATNLSKLATNSDAAALAIRKMTDAASAFGLSISAYQAFRAGERGDTSGGGGTGGGGTGGGGTILTDPTILTDLATAIIDAGSVSSTAAEVIDAIDSSAAALVDAENATQAAADAIDANATSVGALIDATAGVTDVFGATGDGIDLSTLASDAAAALIDSVAAVIATDAAATLADSWAAVDWADALASIYGTDKGSKDAIVPHGAYDPGPSITVNINAGTIVDPTTLTEMVQTAVISNNRYGNSLVPTGTIAG